MSTPLEQPGRDWFKDTPKDDLVYADAMPATGDKRTRFPAGAVLGDGLGLVAEVAALQASGSDVPAPQNNAPAEGVPAGKE